LETLQSSTQDLEDREHLAAEARRGVDHPRLARIDGAERSPSARAQCRACQQAIDKGAWRIRLVSYEDGRFQPSGFIHVPCSQAYFETPDVLPRVKRFSPALREDDLAQLQGELQAPPG
jgi:hypothetical protein